MTDILVHAPGAGVQPVASPARQILQRALHDVDEMHEIVTQLGRYAEVPQHESLF
jgi:hypothetical protein